MYHAIRNEQDRIKGVLGNRKLVYCAKAVLQLLSMYSNDPKFRTVLSGQTVQTQTSLIRVFTVCYFICMFLTKYLKAWTPLFEF